jgi:hypothetical protein
VYCCIICITILCVYHFFPRCALRRPGASLSFLCWATALSVVWPAALSQPTTHIEKGVCVSARGHGDLEGAIIIAAQTFQLHRHVVDARQLIAIYISGSLNSCMVSCHSLYCKTECNRKHLWQVLETEQVNLRLLQITQVRLHKLNLWVCIFSTYRCLLVLTRVHWLSLSMPFHSNYADSQSCDLISWFIICLTI